jgi:regulator of protease activity HflC (stomatin/prohibitin superfamily)
MFSLSAIGGWVIVLIAFYFLSCVRVLAEYDRGVIFRLGRVLSKPKGPGIVFVFWPVDTLVRMSLRMVVADVPPQDVITRDNVSVRVTAVIYFRVVDAIRAVLEVQNYLFATHQLSQTTLRSILGQVDLDELLADREQINRRLQQVLDEQTSPWGVKVSLVELKDVDLPEDMKRVMARQAESERERRAKVIRAEGEYQASARLRDAAKTMQEQPLSLQLRYLQTLTEIGGVSNSRIVAFPLPIELFGAIAARTARNGEPQPDGSKEPSYSMH